MKIFCMSDIHGCINEFKYALSLVEPYLSSDDAKLILLGDYIHRGTEGYAVVELIMSLRQKYGEDKYIALMGNHEEMACDGTWQIEDEPDVDKEKKYTSWMAGLPRYYTEGNTVFVHAGIDEEAEDLWELGTSEYFFTQKYPAKTGRFYKNIKIVAGHIGTAEISGNQDFHDIYYDGESHYYIDGTVTESGIIPVLMVDTDTDKYYRVLESGMQIIFPY